jgi:hypothetical protein
MSLSPSWLAPAPAGRVLPAASTGKARRRATNLGPAPPLPAAAGGAPLAGPCYPHCARSLRLPATTQEAER